MRDNCEFSTLMAMVFFSKRFFIRARGEISTIVEDIFICYDKNLYNLSIRDDGYVYYYAHSREIVQISLLCKYHLFSYERVIFQCHKLSKDSSQVFFTVCLQVYTFYVHRQDNAKRRILADS